MCRFSVVIACHNAQDTLPETLASLRAQTLGDWEAILVDDGSTDGTASVLKLAARVDPRIRVITQKNAGPSRARNVGIAAAKADWIAFLDADDIWVPEKLAHISTVIATAPQSDAIFGKIAFFDPATGEDTTSSSVTEGATPLAALLGENPVCLQRRSRISDPPRR